MTHGIGSATVERWYQSYVRQRVSELSGREKVRVVVMDLSETYRRIARKYFPNAIIVVDRFHVVRLVNQHFLKIWKEHDPLGRVNRGLISLMRRHASNLKPAQQLRLGQYLEEFPVLKALYRARQRLMRFLLLKTVKAKRAKKLLPRFLALIQ